MYPGSIFEYSDQSNISSLPVVTEVRNKPLFCAIFSSDKGPEEWTKVSGSDFFNLYGKQISFDRHGQPLLQAAMSINAGAELLCKRLVADDATLANIGIVAKITTTEGNTTIEYLTKSSSTATTIKEAVADITEALGENEVLLYVITDNGRGASNKKIRIVPNYKISKNYNYVVYNLAVLENDVELESFNFSANPNLIMNGQNISLDSIVTANSTQIKCFANEAGLKAVATAVDEAVGDINGTTLFSNDVLFAKNPKGQAIAGISVSTTGKDLQAATGLSLEGGVNGVFGDTPYAIVADSDIPDIFEVRKTLTVGTDIDTVSTSTIAGKVENAASGDYVKVVTPGEDDGAPATTSYYVYNGSAWVIDDEIDAAYIAKCDIKEAYINAAVDALTGNYDNIIFNTDQYMIDAIIDANYPVTIKEKIASLVTFREDYVYFRDMGLNVRKLSDIKDIVTASGYIKNKFCSDYCQSYDVIDPYSKKQITVTIGYDIAQKLVAHLNNGRNLPAAGLKYGFTVDNAIYGTLNFAPVICPGAEEGETVNEKEDLAELKVNYAAYINNQLVIESLYTSQEDDTQWSYINNVMGIQEVVKAIRKRCPINRYTFIDGDDLERYKADVEEVIDPYRAHFKTLSLEYVSDATYTANKIFYAVLSVLYRDFVQTEMFKVVALNTTSIVEG